MKRKSFERLIYEFFLELCRKSTSKNMKELTPSQEASFLRSELKLLLKKKREIGDKNYSNCYIKSLLEKLSKVSKNQAELAEFKREFEELSK